MSQLFEQEPSKTQEALKQAGKIVAIGVILAVTALGDVMYIQLMNSKFPSGLLLIFCYLGAAAGFLGMVYLLIGKTILFRPGGQTIAAWGLLTVEVLIAALNLMLVFQGNGHLEGAMLVWYQLAPTTPLIVMTGVVLVFFLDPELQKKHKAMETQDRMDVLDQKFAELQHRTQMNLKIETLRMTEHFLTEELQQPDNQDLVRGNAARMFADMMSRFTGFTIAPRINPLTKRIERPAQPQLPSPQEQPVDLAATLAHLLAQLNASSSVPAPKPNEVTGHLEAIKLDPLAQPLLPQQNQNHSNGKA